MMQDVNEEGGMGIHVLPNVLYGGCWLLQARTTEDENPVKQILHKLGANDLSPRGKVLHW